MKKKILTIAMAALFVGLLGLAACGDNKEKTPADVKSGLESAGYTVAGGPISGQTLYTCSKGTSVGNVAFHSTNKTQRDAQKSIGDAAAALSGIGGVTITVKENGNWLYYGDSAFVSAMDGIL